MKASILAASIIAAAACLPAKAHFQLLYTPQVNPAKAGDVVFKLVFWHPFENGPVMAMEMPEQFFYVHRGKRRDLMDRLKPITFHGAENSAAAYEASVPIHRIGDYIFVLASAPYYEKSEDIYIQQITKSYVNRGGIPTGWSEPVGLDAEIVPLNKPTNILAGSTFTGRVLSAGKPVAGAEVEVEHLASIPDMATDRPMPPTAAPMPGGAIVALTDVNGYFTFGIPKAGFWGFAAVGVGPKKQHDGKTLYQDAVLWVRAYAVQ